MDLKRTPLYSQHKNLRGRMVPFAGWEMPVQYSSIIQEHMAVRSRAGLFDVSHMGEILVYGTDALVFLEGLTCNLIGTLDHGRVQYNAIMNKNGGLIDDITIYCESGERFFIVSNASNYDKVYKHLCDLKESYNISIENQSLAWHQLALQGPDALKIWSATTGRDDSDLKYYHFRDIELDGHAMRISRTGYTGEDGLEIYSEPAPGINLWNRLLQVGTPDGILPVGLGARDTLRLEAMYPLYGHELSAKWTPVQSGIGWIVKSKPDGFLGDAIVMEHKQSGAPGRVVPFGLEARGVPREGMPVLDADGQQVAHVLSGSYSPSLKQGIGTAYLPAPHCTEDSSIFVTIRNQAVPARVRKGAFVKGGAGGG